MNQVLDAPCERGTYEATRLTDAPATACLNITVKSQHSRLLVRWNMLAVAMEGLVREGDNAADAASLGLPVRMLRGQECKLARYAASGGGTWISCGIG